jgi:alpha-beta hydrolase superfamily lysophospholipase/2-polyprenyl-3-methyl-5-hydroxy-6-metoxy-1,4-benzoquinol methylase
VLHLYADERPDPAYAVVLVHGTAGHGGCYDRFARTLAELGANVYALDLQGHGRSGGERGIFSMEGFLGDVAAAARFARERSGRRVVLVGASQGGEVAFHALCRSPDAEGAVCMNVLFCAERPMNRRIAFMRGRAAAGTARLLGDRLRVPLPWVIDFRAAYREDPALLVAKRRDPLYVWSYGFRSYRSIFSHEPPRPARENQKPVLIACGELDPIVPAAHCRACFERLGGPKSFLELPGAGHQLMEFHTERFGRAVHSWALHAVVEKRPGPWLEPEDRARRRFVEFLRAEERAAHHGEPEYALSRLDRALCTLANGRIVDGVRFFAERRRSSFGRFVSEVVAGIDVAAWKAFAAHLPRVAAARMAVLGCGDGLSISALLAEVPALRTFEIVGVDIDPEAIEAATRRFSGNSRVRFVAADARHPDALEGGSFDVVYSHGVFDHCSDHRALALACHRALRPGGSLFYIAPDRNLLTWLRFVSLGPRFFFPLGRYRGIHDFRRFPRPREMERLLREVGFVPEGMNLGVEYRRGPAGIWWGVRRRDLAALRLEIRRPRLWMRGGFPGEYLGIARRP